MILEDVLMFAAKNQTEPVCVSFGPMETGSQPAFAALIAAYSASGEIEAAWLSEPMFESPEAAIEHAEDLVSPNNLYEW